MLGKSVDGQEQLEEMIETLAGASGIDDARPFPFIVDGTVKSVDYHILSPKTADSSATDHRSSAKTLTSKDVPVRVVGFFSRNHGGVFTHMGSKSHLHVLDSNGHSGHVDAISFNSEAMVFFPR